MKTATFKQDKAGAWSQDPTGEVFEIFHEAAGITLCRCPRLGVTIGVPSESLAPTTSAKEAIGGVQGKGGQ